MFGLNIAVLSFLKVFWADNCSFSRLITKYAIVLQFTTALLSTSCDNSVITIYVSLVITVLDNCYYILRQVLQFTTLSQSTTA